MNTYQSDRSNEVRKFKWMEVCVLAAILFALPTVARATYVSAVLADNPIGYWRMDENGGTYVLDTVSGGAVNYARCNPPDVVMGGTAGAIPDGDTAATFSGGQGLGTTVRFIDYPALADFGVGDAYTLEAWIKTTDAGNQTIISKRTANGYFGYNLSLWSGQLAMHFTGDGNANADSFTYKYGGPALNDGQWHYVVGTHVAGTAPSSLSLYADGSLITGTTDYTQTVGSFGDTYNPTEPLHFGYHSLAGFAFTGAMDEVAIYSSALSAGQIAAHYAQTLPEPSIIVLMVFGGLCVRMRRRRA